MSHFSRLATDEETDKLSSRQNSADNGTCMLILARVYALGYDIIKPIEQIYMGLRHYLVRGSVMDAGPNPRLWAWYRGYRSPNIFTLTLPLYRGDRLVHIVSDFEARKGGAERRLTYFTTLRPCLAPHIF